MREGGGERERGGGEDGCKSGDGEERDGAGAGV